MTNTFSTQTIEQLGKEITTRQEKIAEIRFARAGGKVKNVREARLLRKEIAQINTAIKQKSL